MVTLKQINKQVQHAGYNVELVSCKTYFMVVGVDDNWRDILNVLHSTSIPCFRLNQMTLERWVADVVDICEDAKKKTERYK